MESSQCRVWDRPNAITVTVTVAAAARLSFNYNGGGTPGDDLETGVGSEVLGPWSCFAVLWLCVARKSLNVSESCFLHL